VTTRAPRWIGLIALAFALVCPVAARAADVVKMGELPSISNVGLYVAIDKGYFQARGITVEIEPFASGAKMVPALATGQLDVAIGTPSAGLYNAIAGGMDFKIVADKGQTRPGYNFTPLVVRKDLVDSGRVKSIKDLKGLKIASGAKGINFDYMLAKMLEHGGLGFDSVDIVYVGYPEGIKALAAKAVDAAFVPEPWGMQAEQQKVGVRLFLPEQTPAISTFQVAVIMYGAKFMKERPRVAREFLHAYVQGVKLYNQRGLKDPEVAGMVSRHMKLPVEMIQATLPPYVDVTARPRVQDLAAMQDWFHQMGWVKEKVPMEKVVDLTFLE